MIEIIPGKLYKINTPLWFSKYPSKYSDAFGTGVLGAGVFIPKNEYLMCIRYDRHFNHTTKYHYETLVCMHYNKLLVITRYINTLALCLNQV